MYEDYDIEKIEQEIILEDEHERTEEMDFFEE